VNRTYLIINPSITDIPGAISPVVMACLLGVKVGGP
jgi:hypothetical protein